MKKYHQWLLNLLMKLDLSVEKAVDIGCGNGVVTNTLMHLLKATEVIGIDKEASEVLAANQDFGSAFLRFEQGDITNIKKNIKTSDFLKDDYFHLAHCRYLLYHIYEDHGELALKSAIKEMKRVVMRGGLIIAVEHPSYEFGNFFEQAELISISCIDDTEKRYCYRKLH